MTGCSCILRHYRRLAVQGGKGTTDVSRAPERLLERSGTFSMTSPLIGTSDGSMDPGSPGEKRLWPILKTDENTATRVLELESAVA